MKQTRTTYSPAIKLAVQMNALTPEMRGNIPSSTLSGFKSYDLSKVYGFETSTDFLDRIEHCEELLKAKELESALKAYLRIKHVLLTVREKAENRISTLRRVKDKVVACINFAKTHIPLVKVCSMFRISISTYRSWKKQVALQCRTSPLGLCYKTWPNQLTRNEQDTIRKLCRTYLSRGWSIVNIAWHGFRNNMVTASVSTWYKYVKLLGITSKRIKKPKQKKGITSERCNELWHADVTVFKTADNLVHYIYIIMDNFSRYILSYKVSRELRGSIMLENLKQAYETHGPDSNDVEVSLLTDGGPENRNRLVEGYAKKETVGIKQIIARQDVHFSNSMVEAINKTMKYNFLFRKDQPDTAALEKNLPEAVKEYNTVRCPGALKGLTPAEVYSGRKFDKDEHVKRIEKAKNERLKVNRKENCPICEE